MCYFVILTLILLTTTRVCGQEIQLQLAQNVSTCSEGLRAGTDKYLINGTAGPNVTALTAQSWESSVQFGVFNTSTSQFSELCLIRIGSTGGFCVPTSTSPCYCDQFNTATGLAHFVVSYTAVKAHSQNKLLCRWRNSNGPEVYSVQNISLPAIYDVSDAGFNLTVNGHTAVENNGICGGSFIAGEMNNITLCCTNTPSPCYPMIAFDGNISASLAQNQSGCVIYKVQSPSDTVTITKSCSVCSQSDYIPAGSCIINTSQTTTPAPTTTTGVENPTTPSSPTDNGTHVGKDSELDQKLSLGLAIPGGVIIIVIIVCCCCCFCNDKNATLVCCCFCCCTEKGVSIYCCCYDGQIFSTPCCSCNPLNNGESGGIGGAAATGGQLGSGADDPGKTDNAATNRSRNDTIASVTVKEIVEMKTVKTKNDGDVSKNGQTKIDPNVDVPHSAKRSKNATTGSELQSEESKDIQTKKKEAPSSKTGQTSAKGQR